MEASRAGQKLRLLRPPADRAFEQLYQRHAREVYQYALALLTNPADAEDVTQTTFLNAYRAFKRGERPHKPHNWLIAITHNVCRMRWRQAGARPREVALDEAPEPAATDHERPNLDEVLTALANLSFNQRAALVMRELEGRTYAEIAEILGLSVSAVETLIFRARRALREQLETSITCDEAERAISLQLDGRLPRADKAGLRAHLRTCKDCATFARSQRAQRAALKSFGAVPLPASLTSLFGGGAGAGSLVAAKLAAVGAAGVLVAGGSLEAAREIRAQPSPRAAVPVERAARPSLPPILVAAAALSSAEEQPSAHRARPLPRRVRPHAVPAVPRRARTHKTATVTKTKPKPKPAVTAASSHRATPAPPVRARGRGGAPGQLKPDPVVKPTSANAAPGRAESRVLRPGFLRSPKQPQKSFRPAPARRAQSAAPSKAPQLPPAAVAGRAQPEVPPHTPQSVPVATPAPATQPVAVEHAASPPASTNGGGRPLGGGRP